MASCFLSTSPCMSVNSANRNVPPMSASGCGLNRPLAVLHEGQLWVDSCLPWMTAFGRLLPVTTGLAPEKGADWLASPMSEMLLYEGVIFFDQSRVPAFIKRFTKSLGVACLLKCYLAPRAVIERPEMGECLIKFGAFNT